MEWRGVTTTNVYVANFFFVAALGLVISAQWELSVGNGFAYTVYSAFGKLTTVQASPTRPLTRRHRILLRGLRSHLDAVVWNPVSVWF